MFRGSWYVVVCLLTLSGQLFCWTTEAIPHSHLHHHHHYDDNDSIIPLISFLQGPHEDQGKNHYNRMESIMKGRKSPGEEERVGEESVSGVVKRVFLSRGWGPGGYNAPPPPPPPPPSPPHRFVRRPPAPPQSSPAAAPAAAVGTTRTDRIQPPPQSLIMGKSLGLGGARFAALVSAARQRALPSQPKATSRRFHSIFTSGTWRPLGKRRIHSHPSKAPSGSFLKENLDEDRNDYLDDTTRQVVSNIVKIMELDGDVRWPRHQGKRSGVFASHGWGAGGSGTSSSHPWISLSPPSSTWGSHITPGVRDVANWHGGHGNQPKSNRDSHPHRGESHSAIGDRHLVSFRGNTPLFHLFLSHGWGPMGR